MTPSHLGGFHMPPPGPEPAEPGTQAEPLDDAVFAAHANFRRTLREFLRFSERAARQAGVTPEQHQMLLAIRGAARPWMLVGEIATALMVAPHSALGLVERAAAAGLVHKERDPDDHRKVRVSLTPAADILIRDLTLAHGAELRRLWRQIPPPE